MIRLHLFVVRSHEIIEMRVRLLSIHLHSIVYLQKEKILWGDRSTKMGERERRYFISLTDNEGCNARRKEKSGQSEHSAKKSTASVINEVPMK
jgi:hypothetical protein